MFHSSLFCFCSTLLLFVARKKLRKIWKLLFLCQFRSRSISLLFIISRALTFTHKYSMFAFRLICIYIFLFLLFFFLFVCMYIPIIQPAEREKIVARVTQVDKVFFSDFFIFKYFCLWECVCVYLLLLAWIYKCSVVCVSNKTCFLKKVYIHNIYCMRFFSQFCLSRLCCSK